MISRNRVVRQLVGQVVLRSEADATEVLAKRGEVDASSHDLGVGNRMDRLEYIGLRLEHLIAHWIGERLTREPDQSEPEQVVEIGRHSFDLTAAGARPDHRQAGRDQARADHAEGPARPDVDSGLWSFEQEQPQDTALVRR